ncbi:tRNA 2-thiouridine(34) synthase MnmA [Patescibacteria group bacterium]|nr:tRNA 2-thiouridine(34) synthase MnmA [Patescibacteria group bacterium]MBU1895369.1 tRNA 2-thiouridine(34) synthase MnmA [Patescibacteria group bacterium]
MLKNKEKILVAMSGGVDSSVAVALLLDRGYDVTGAFMVNYQSSPFGLRLASSGLDEERLQGEAPSGAETCWLPDYRDALRVAAKLGIPLLKLDFTKEYKDLVLDNMFKEYEQGRTPNPDVLCNKFIKFGVWLNKARELGFDKLATGHYARLGVKENRNWKLETRNDINSFQFPISNFQLFQAKDSNKDQTYFLHQLTQEQLQHVMFPLGEYTKDEVRKLARKFELPTAEKEESMGICFIGEVPMEEFLKTRIKEKSGSIVTSSGEVLGEHKGLAFYTIGQRHIGMMNDELRMQNNGGTRPLYVVDKNFKKNHLVVGYEDDPLLYKKEILVTDVNWISGHEPDFPVKCKVRLRHRQPLQRSTINDQRSGVSLKFEEPQKAVTPGQFAVFYKDGECLGGGVIK